MAHHPNFQSFRVVVFKENRTAIPILLVLKDPPGLWIALQSKNIGKK
jgi:hypothetical protein